jgi:serine/threonine protein kinase
LEPNRTLSHYRLIEKIGEGGMGVVWKAEDTVLGRTVAVKVLPADLARDEQRRKMFLDEARLASSVSEAHIVQVFEFGREGDLDFIVMEYVEGKPLSQVLKGRSLTPDRIAEIGHQVARALARAHRQGLLHRDLKPSNILITPDGDAKVVDFGLAALFTRGESTFGGGNRALSEVETFSAGERPEERRIAGTLPYMSPEQVRGEDLDARSDIFSLGVVLYEMTTGQRPFTRWCRTFPSTSTGASTRRWRRAAGSATRRWTTWRWTSRSWAAISSRAPRRRTPRSWEVFAGARGAGGWPVERRSSSRPRWQSPFSSGRGASSLRKWLRPPGGRSPSRDPRPKRRFRRTDSSWRMWNRVDPAGNN